MENNENHNKFKLAIFSGIIILFFGAFMLTEAPGMLTIPFPNNSFIFFFSILLNILLKILIIIFYLHWARKKEIFNVRFSLGFSTLVLILFAFAIAIFIKDDYHIIYVYTRFSKEGGIYLGAINTTMTYIYYFCEGILMIFMVDVFQTAFEEKTNQFEIPWGGIFLALFWGGFHFFTKGFDAFIWGLAIGTIIGVFYEYDKKILWSPFIFWMLINFI